MSNIEIWGFSEYQSDIVVDGIRDDIEKLFRDEKFANELVVTHVHSNVTTLAGSPEPFLRVWSTNKEEGVYIYNVLRMTGWYVERPVKLADFAEAAMWTADEIMEDLECIRNGSRKSGNWSTRQVQLAIQDLQKHKYSSVAVFYKQIALELSEALDGWWPESLGIKINPTTLNDSENDIMARLTMVKQIINSLDPSGKIEGYS